MNSHIDTRIYEAVTGSTPDKPLDLVGILHYVDSREKMVLSYDELENGLRRLVEQGRIAELPGNRYYEVKDGSSPSTFMGFSSGEHRRACEAYRSWFRQAYKELNKK
jgi:hypothetical protein